jgi:DNA-binding LytR/AlgR family response regulator
VSASTGETAGGRRAERLTVLAVDDERTQLEDLARLLRSFPDVEDVECASDGHDALLRASAQPFDAIFLDVRMPDLDGLELARVLKRFAVPPQLVFVSAYDNAAVDAFELEALDYLRKPVSRQRLQEALRRVSAAVQVAHPGPGPAEAPPAAATLADSDLVAVANVRTGATRIVSRHEILYAQSDGDFVRLVTDEGRYLLRVTLAELERRWEPHGFVRVHRQYVANLRRALELRPHLGSTAELVFRTGQSIPVARRHVAELSHRLEL